MGLGSPSATDTGELAGTLRASLGLLVRRLRAVQVAGDLTLPEASALARLDRGGPTSASELAKQEQISPQSIGATLRALEDRGLVARAPDPLDGRRIVLSISDAGLRELGNRRNAKIERLATALAAEFTAEELARLGAAAPLLERLAERI